MAGKIKANRGDLNVGIMVIQPTKEGIEEIANTLIKVPNRTINKTKELNEKKKVSTSVKKSTKPNIKTVEKPKTRKPKTTKDERVEDK